MPPLLTLALTTLLVHAPPPPPTCTLTRDATHLLATRAGRPIGRLPLPPATPSLATPHTVASLSPSRSLVTLTTDWAFASPSPLGLLFELDCARPTRALRRVLAAPGVDFASAAPLPDGRLLVGGWGGLALLTLEGRSPRLTPLTAAPPHVDPTCWSYDPDAPTLTARVDLPTPLLPVAPGEVSFRRGSPCGYEGDLIWEDLVLTLATGAIRPRVPIHALVHRGATLTLLAGSCGTRTAGFWTSPDLHTWTHHPLAGTLPPVALVTTHLPLALSARCTNSAAGEFGGDLFTSPDEGRSWARFALSPPPDAPTLAGLGAAALSNVNGQIYIGFPSPNAPLSAPASRWFILRGGELLPSPPPPPPPRAPFALAPAALHVAAVYGVMIDPLRQRALAWTDDGLFGAPLNPLTGLPAPGLHSSWQRLFPPASLGSHDPTAHPPKHLIAPQTP